MLPLFRRISGQFPSLAVRRIHNTLVAASFPAGTGVRGPPVAVFWDLDNMPPNSIHPYDAAVRLRLAAYSLGHLRFAVAHATPQTLRRIPAATTASRLQESGASEPCVCRVCGRNFFAHSKLLNHFKIHEREHAKRLGRIESATGGRYVRLKSQLNMKMEKYRKAAREILIPRVGHTLGDELRRAGISIQIAEGRPSAAHQALTEHMSETIERRRVGCLVLVSKNVGFAGIIREARTRCLKTVVVGDDGDGSLKRCADSSFSWKDIVSGKAKQEAGSAVLKWKDKDLLKKLEWRNQPELDQKEGKLMGSEWGEMNSGDESASVEGEDLTAKRASKPWWKLN
ncbi:hypothetical protein KSP40_PGU010183 [Platanthera guangdongensis]|uniref:C2H2-type domain-containing protein n=1 Tax=Platanthera guangdongensis TaxID=2320717 RepID=A0ABR2MTC7_9ASPA